MRRAVLLCAAVLLGTGVFAAPAGAAGPPAPATGSYQIPAATDDVTFIKASSGNLFLHEVAPLVYQGDVTGASVDVDNFVVHADGTFQGAGTETCDVCSIDGHTGSYRAAFNFQGSGDNYAGHLILTSTGGGLAGLHGGGTFTGTQSGTGGTYSYQFVWGP